MTATRRIDIGGLKLAVTQHGTGHPVVFHPGLGYGAWSWRKLAPLIATRYRTVSVDPRGAGRSDKPAGPYTVEQLAEDIAALLAVLGLDSAHIVGHSMGGYVAQVLALRRPCLVRSLILLATSPGGPEAKPVPVETRTAWQQAAQLPSEEFARRTFPYSFRPGWTHRHQQEYEADLAERLRWPTPPDRWRDQYAACVAFLEEGIPVEEISQPTLIIHGTADRVVPVANAKLLAERIPHAQLRLFPGAGHNLMLEEPQLVAATILEFLKSRYQPR